MKLVKEYINEKFTDESDPIKDMGIGIDEQIKKFMKNDIEEYDEDSDATTTNINIILGYAIAYEKEDFVKYLLNKGADINNSYVFKWFLFACKYEHLQMVKLLIKYAFNIHGNEVANYEKGLRIAIINNNINIVKILVEAGADIHAINDRPIKLAAAHNRLKIIKYFYEKRKEERRKKINKFFHLKENLYEKFTDISDPIKDLGIGTTNWKNLKRGDIIKCIKFTQFSGFWSPFKSTGETICNNPRKSWMGNLFEQEEYYRLLDNPELRKDGKITMYTRNTKHGNGSDRLVLTPKQLNKRFKIIKL